MNVIAFRRTRLNQNSIAPVAGALLSSGVPDGFQIAIVDQTEHLPRHTRLVAFSFCTSALEEIRSEVRTIRKAHRDTLTLVAGGPHPSADPEGVLAAGFDAVFVGEGERTFPRFIEAWASDKVILPLVQKADPTPFDLDSSLHVVPSLGLFPFAEISRGCNFGCAFCQVSVQFGHGMRHRSPEVIGEGIAQAIEMGFRRFRFLTPDAFAYAGGGYQRGEEALSALLAAARKAGATQLMLGSFPSEVRPDHVTPRLLALLRRECFNRTLVMGAQSGSDRVLSKMRRGHTVEQVREAVALAFEAGFIPHIDVLFCFPGEQPEERGKTLELMRWCIERGKARFHAHVYLPLPGTALWPTPPEPLEKDLFEQIKRLEALGRVDGDWGGHHSEGRKFLRWRDEGKIRI